LDPTSGSTFDLHPRESSRTARLEAKGPHSGNFLFKAEQETNGSAIHWDRLGLEI
jgi:hypothetical protein